LGIYGVNKHQSLKPDSLQEESAFVKASAEIARLKYWINLIFTNPTEYQKIIDSKESPLIPYISYELQNLLQIIEKEPTFISGSSTVINFVKCIKLFHILKHLRDIQHMKYNLLPVFQICVFFDGFDEYGNMENKRV